MLQKTPAAHPHITEKALFKDQKLPGQGRLLINAAVSLIQLSRGPAVKHPPDTVVLRGNNPQRAKPECLFDIVTCESTGTDSF